MSDNNSNKTTNKADKFRINVCEHESFDGIVETKYISSGEFCKLVSDLFRGIYADFEGCAYEVNQQGLGNICLFFNHSEPDEEGRVNGITRTMPEKSNLRNDTVRRIRQHDSYNRNGDRYFLTEEGSQGLSDFVYDNMINKKDGKVNWDRLTAEVGQRQIGYNQRNISYTKISMLDPNKLATVIFGSTDEYGNNLCYGVNIMRSVNQVVVPGMQGNIQTQYMLSINKVSENEVVKLCNQLGVAPNQGLDIIR